MNKKDRIYQEADSACAICGTKGDKILSMHHIDHSDKDKERETNHEYENLILLCHNCHIKHHQHPNLLSRKTIQECKRQLILKTITQYGLNALKLASNPKGEFIAHPFMVFHLVDLGYLEQKSEVSSYGETTISQIFETTESGKKIVRIIERNRK